MLMWSAIGAIGSISAALVAAFAARQSRLSSEKANDAATTMAGIESNRRQAQLTPRLQVSLIAHGEDSKELIVALLGPPALGHLDSLRASIRDNHFDTGQVLMTDGLTEKEINDQVWGPFRFQEVSSPGRSRCDPMGKHAYLDSPLAAGDAIVFQLGRTEPPPDSDRFTGYEWTRKVGDIVRLSFEATRSEFGHWTLWTDIPAGRLISGSIERVLPGKAQREVN